MLGHFGFSYIGLLFLFLLFIPNILWANRKPQGYTSQKENRVLLCLERTGEVLVCCCALGYSDFDWHGYSAWAWWLFAAVALMVLYELWWVRYFRSERTLSDFYSSFLGVPVAGATLPVLAFLLLGIYGKAIYDNFRRYIGNRAHWDTSCTSKRNLMPDFYGGIYSPQPPVDGFPAIVW